MIPRSDPPDATPDWRVNMRLTDAWFKLFLDHEPDLAAMESQVDARIQREPDLADERQKLVDMLAHFSRQASQRGVVSGALRWAVNELGHTSIATLYLSSYVDSRFNDTEQLLPILEARMAPRHGSDQVEPEVETRDLAVGKAVRVQVISDTSFTPANHGSRDGNQNNTTRRPPFLETVQYWLPVPGDEVILVFTLATPNLVNGEAAVKEFDQIIEHVQLG